MFESNKFKSNRYEYQIKENRSLCVTILSWVKYSYCQTCFQNICFRKVTIYIKTNACIITQNYIEIWFKFVRFACINILSKFAELCMIIYSFGSGLFVFYNAPNTQINPRYVALTLRLCWRSALIETTVRFNQQYELLIRSFFRHDRQ